MKKTALNWTLLAVSAAMMLAGMAFVPQAEAKTLRYAAHGSPKGVRAEAVKWWASEIEKRTNKQIKFRFFWSGALLKPGDAMEGIGRGTANVGGGWGIYHPAKTPLWTVADPPFSHSDPYAGIMAMAEMFETYKPLQDELAKYNVKLLAPFVTGMTQLGTGKKVKAILVPADAAGKKIRFAGGQWAKFWKSCNAVPVKVTQGEVYEVLMRGTVDATQSYFFILEAYKHWDVIKDYTVINAGELASYGLVINIDDWKALTPEQKKIFKQVSKEMALRYAKGLIETKKRIKKLGAKKGMVFHDLTPEQMKLWKEKAAPLMAAWAKSMDEKGLPGTETQQLFLKLVGKYQKEVAEKGYPWERK